MLHLADPHLHYGVALLAEVAGLIRPILQLDADLGKRASNAAEVAGVLNIERFLVELLERVGCRRGLRLVELADIDDLAVLALDREDLVDFMRSSWWLTSRSSSTSALTA